jgi:hypothetical protein
MGICNVREWPNPQYLKPNRTNPWNSKQVYIVNS